MSDAEARPIPVQFTVTVTALVYPEPDAGGYSAEVPALPGCYTQGETLEEVRANLREAAEGWLSEAHSQATARLCSHLASRTGRGLAGERECPR